MKKITIIIPFHNCAETKLKIAIDSILKQTLSDFEFILVNDCSTNNCPAIAEEYAAQDARIKLVHNPKKLGCPKARERGLHYASGDYILMGDSDDYMESDMLRQLYLAAEKTDADIVYCDYYKHFADEVELVRQGNVADKINFFKDIFANKVWGVIWNKLVKKSIYEKIIFPSCFYSEDTVQTIQIVYFAERIEYVPQPLYHYFDHTTFSHYQNKNACISLCRNYTIIVDFLKQQYPDMSLFEPELSQRVNEYKYRCSYVCDTQLTREIFQSLYPESNKLIMEHPQIGFFGKLQFLCIAHKLCILPFICKNIIRVRLFIKKFFNIS